MTRSKKSRTTTPTRTCKRCGSSHNIDHDNPIDLCNLCTDAIQSGADSNHFDPAERELEVVRAPRPDGFIDCDYCTDRLPRTVHALARFGLDAELRFGIYCSEGCTRARYADVPALRPAPARTQTIELKQIGELVAADPVDGYMGFTGLRRCNLADCSQPASDSGPFNELCKVHADQHHAQLIGRSNASCAFDASTGKHGDYRTRSEAIEAHAINVVDTCREYKLGKLDTELALKTFKAECKVERKRDRANAAAQKNRRRVRAAAKLLNAAERAVVIEALDTLVQNTDHTAATDQQISTARWLLAALFTAATTEGKV